ncbi:hypothetical protein WJX73_010896 [Symbiochloris irregularis]|uniref:SigF-like NTF2-like domain-containing protein n=1 Tax=Symbiochloris irregularis TaxID=706552 RepID=A0AAW1NKV0_9CHLO
MQNLDQDLKRAFQEALQGDHRQRRDCINKVFTDDASFWHIAHIADGKEDIWGIYQLWAGNNRKIGIEFLRIVPDPQRKVVVVDILEHCHIWWNPLFTFTGGPVVYLHTILELKHTAELRMGHP